GAFFKSAKLNDAVGVFIGILTFTPYYSWSQEHYIHHETAGNLDKRDRGDVWTLTVAEYQESSGWRKIVYRFYRHPVTMFGIGAFLVFVILNRFTKKNMDRKGRLGVYATNLGLFVFAGSLSMLMGVKAFFLIQMPIRHLGLQKNGPGRKFLLQTSTNPPVLLREYRVSPYPSSQPDDPEL
ncbi:MAG: fatty acid desaturase, partial [Bacteroidetes bacterium]|nr:fatty acid desaturase [Bacteroidota bacterium]